MSEAKNELNPEVMAERVAERLKAIDFIGEIAAAPITGSQETGYRLKMRFLDANTEQELRTMASTITSAKAIEIPPPSAVKLKDSQEGTDIIASQKVLYAVQEEMKKSILQRKIPDSIKPFVHNAAEKAEDRVSAVEWKEGIHAHDQAAHTSSFEVKSFSGPERVDLMRLLRKETLTAKESGLPKVAEPDISDLGFTTTFVVDSRVKDAMLERITAERAAIDVEVQKALKARGTDRTASIGR